MSLSFWLVFAALAVGCWMLTLRIAQIWGARAGLAFVMGLFYLWVFWVLLEWLA